MPVPSYSLVIGTVTGYNDKDRDHSPHLKVFVDTGNGSQEAPINMASTLAPHDLLVRIEGADRKFESVPDSPLSAASKSLIKSVESLKPGVYSTGNFHGPDYVREHNFTKDSFTPIPASGQPGNLFDAMTELLDQAAKETTTAYIFGSKYKGGIHDIHMNQGNRGNFRRDNGANTDGMVLLHFTEQDTWIAFYSAFQSQTFDTDEQGNPRGDARLLNTLFFKRPTDRFFDTVTSKGESVRDLLRVVQSPSSNMSDAATAQAESDLIQLLQEGHGVKIDDIEVATKEVEMKEVPEQKSPREFDRKRASISDMYGSEHLNDTEVLLRQRAAETLANMQLGLPYAAPFAAFVTFGDMSNGDYIQRHQAADIVKDIRTFIHETCSKTHTSMTLGINLDVWSKWQESLPDIQPVRGMIPSDHVNRVLSRAEHVYKNSHGVVWCHIKSDVKANISVVVEKLESEMLHRHGMRPLLPAVHTESRGGVESVSCPHSSIPASEQGGGSCPFPTGRVLGARFAENMQNPGSPVDVLEYTLIGEEDPIAEHRGGSFVFAQQFRVNWGMLHASGDTNTEDMVGRKAHTDEFLPSPEHDSHVKCSHVEDPETGDTVRILRLGQPFGRRQIVNGGTLADEQGIYFAGFAKSAAALLKVVESQVGPHDGFVRDRLLQSGVSSMLGGLFYTPSLADLGLALNRKVLHHGQRAFNRQHDGELAWNRFPGIDWSRLPRHFLEKHDSNKYFFHNHHEYMYTMSTAPASELNTLRPPSLRILNLAGKVFDRWQDSWYRGRNQQEMCKLEQYAHDYFALNPEAMCEVGAGSNATATEATKLLMELPVALRKAWAIRLACGFVFTDKNYGRRGLLNQKAIMASDSVPSRYGADTFHMNPLEIIVGGMPNLSLGQGKFMIDYAKPDEEWPNFFKGFSYASGVGHVVPDYTEALEKGTAAIREELLCKSKEDNKTFAFYQASMIALQGVEENCRAFASLAQELQHKYSHDVECAEYRNLEVVQETMERLGRGEAPRNLREAAQLVFSLHSCLHLIGEPVAIGRLDQILEPFYKPDEPSAAFDAQEVIDAFFLKLADKTMFNRQFFVDHQPPGHLAMGNASGPYPQGASFNQWIQQLTVGGQKDDGSPAFNDITIFCIRASRRLPLNAPVLSLRLYRMESVEDQEMLRPYIEEASISLLSGGAMPVLLNDDKVIPGLQKSMVKTRTSRDKKLIPIEHARNYACDGCYEPMFVGRNWFMLGGFPVLKVLEYALNQGLSLFDAGPTFLHGKSESFRSEPSTEIESFDHLMQLFYRHFEWTYAKQTQGFVSNFGRLSEVCPAPLLSVFIKGCRERGRDMYNGGPEYNVVGPCFTGLANVVNSLWAIKVLCFDEATAMVSLTELIQCLACDWGENMTDPYFQPRLGEERIAKSAERYRHLRSHALALPRWGRGEKEIDQFGNGVCKRIAKLCHKLFDDASIETFPGLRDAIQTMADKPELEGMGDVCIQPGVGTFEGYVDNGLALAASADGRAKGSPIATDMSPSPTPANQTPAEILKAMEGVSSVDGFAFWNGAPVDKNVNETFPLEHMVEVVTSFANGVGSNIMTITVANESTFSAAMDCPERYDCVRVRTGGWTEFFAALPLEHQKVHISRPRDIP